MLSYSFTYISTSSANSEERGRRRKSSMNRKPDNWIKPWLFPRVQRLGRLVKELSKYPHLIPTITIKRIRGIVGPLLLLHSSQTPLRRRATLVTFTELRRSAPTLWESIKVRLNTVDSQVSNERGCSELFSQCHKYDLDWFRVKKVREIVAYPRKMYIFSTYCDCQKIMSNTCTA